MIPRYTTLSGTALAFGFFVCASSAQAQTTRVSVSSAGIQANASSQSPAISGDGLVVAFISQATNLTPEGVPGTFARDLSAGITTLLSRSTTQRPSLSIDGRYVLVGADSGSRLVVLDRQTAVRATIPPIVPGPFEGATLSAGGRHVAFSANSARDIYVYGLDDASVCSAHVASTSEHGDLTVDPDDIALSRDGRLVGFISSSTNLTPADTNSVADVFIHDCDTGTTELGGLGPHGLSQARFVEMSADGRFVDNGFSVRDRDSSVSIDFPDLDSAPPAHPHDRLIAGNGAHWAVSYDIVEPGFASHRQYVFDRRTRQHVPLEVSPSGGPPDMFLRSAPGVPQLPEQGISDDGRIVVFRSAASNLTTGDTNNAVDIFVRHWMDPDGDAMDSAWEQAFGFDPYNPSDAAMDSDSDGRDNAAEYSAGSHPRASSHEPRYFAEGSATHLFATSLHIANPDTTNPARVVVRLTPAHGPPVWQVVTIPASQSTVVQANMVLPSGGSEFTTKVEADRFVATDRRMQWNRSGYGAHAEVAQRTATRWHFAEGSTVGGFQLFYIVQNPGAATATVQMRLLLPTSAEITRSYSVPPQGRTTIWVNQIQSLSATDVAADFSTASPSGLVVERAMYLSSSTQFFAAGHSAAGTQPSVNWFFAEGATGDYFDQFILLGNPDSRSTRVLATYMLPNGVTYQKAYQLPGSSRRTTWVDHESIGGSTPLANTPLSVSLASLDSVPIVAERSMWWPGAFPSWQEAHATAGSPGVAAPSWVVADGAVSAGVNATNTYLLIANTSERLATVKVTLLLQQRPFPGPPPNRTFSIPARARFTFDVAGMFPYQSYGFGALVESLGADPAQLVVERSIYSDADGIRWAAGANALATPYP